MNTLRHVAVELEIPDGETVWSDAIRVPSGSTRVEVFNRRTAGTTDVTVEIHGLLDGDDEDADAAMLITTLTPLDSLTAPGPQGTFAPFLKLKGENPGGDDVTISIRLVFAEF